LLVPGFAAILRGAGGRTLFYTWFWGAMWGVGGLLFGLGVRYLGIALGYAIALGFSTAFGTLVPPLFAGQFGAIVRDRAGQVVILGVAVCLGAIVVSGVAGRIKERELTGKECGRGGGSMRQG
jgi:L-rhamnose-H+ transport protein